MSNIRICLALLIMTSTPALISYVNGGNISPWMIWLAIIGAAIAFIKFLLPKRDDLG